MSDFTFSDNEYRSQSEFDQNLDQEINLNNDELKEFLGNQYAFTQSFVLHDSQFEVNRIINLLFRKFRKTQFWAFFD